MKRSIVLACALAAVAWGHHSFAAEYDTKRPVHLEGVVARFEFMNPHGEIYLDAGSEHWWIETASPVALARRGVSKRSVSAGMHIVIDGYQARDGSHRAYGLSLTLEDGRVLELNQRH